MDHRYEKLGIQENSMAFEEHVTKKLKNDQNIESKIFNIFY